MKNVQVTFTGTPDSDNSKLLSLNRTATDGQSLSDDANTLKFAAYLQGSSASATVVPGDFTSVANRPCNIEPQSAHQLVEMGTVVVKTLYRLGHTVPVPFDIKRTDCITTVFESVNVTLSGTEDTELPGKLAINNGSNGAAIALFDHQGMEIDLNRATRTVALKDGLNVLNFSAHVQGHPNAIQNKAITEGEFSLVANFVLAYQ